jgi:hypothetical protein
MKKFTQIFTIILAISLLGCKESTSDVEISPNYCVPEGINLNGSSLLKLGYDTEHKFLKNVTINASEEEITTTFVYDQNNKIISAESDMGEQIFSYTGNNITKVVLKEDNVVTGEKIISYTGNNISKIEEFTIDGSEKALSLGFYLEYNGDNIKKINMKMPDFISKEFAFYEGTSYSTNLSEYAGLANFKQALLISNVELFSFLPSNFMANILSKNTVEKGKLSFSIIEVLFGALFGGLSDEAEILKSITLMDFNNTSKTNEKGFVNSMTTTYGTAADNNDPIQTTVNFFCN